MSMKDVIVRLLEAHEHASKLMSCDAELAAHIEAAISRATALLTKQVSVRIDLTQQQVERLRKGESRISIIKELRNKHGISLLEAKQITDRYTS